MARHSAPKPAVSARAIRPRLISAIAGGALPVAAFEALQDYAISVGPGTQKLIILVAALLAGYGHVDYADRATTHDHGS